uniref:Uncharacterized protein n=1 Tax=Glossina austeni TaxID=7395 RepID=A0A1A9V314_GLOAU
MLLCNLIAFYRLILSTDRLSSRENIHNNISYYIKYNQCLLTNISLLSIIGTKTNEVVPDEYPSDDLIEVKIKYYSLLATVAEAFSPLPNSLLPNLTICYTFIT